MMISESVVINRVMIWRTAFLAIHIVVWILHPISIMLLLLIIAGILLLRRLLLLLFLRVRVVIEPSSLEEVFLAATCLVRRWGTFLGVAAVYTRKHTISISLFCRSIIEIGSSAILL
jgi:hypothetical protein